MSNILQPVKLDLTPPESGMQLLEVLYDIGFENPILFGGSLRDTFRKVAFKDLDIRVGTPPAFDGATVLESAFDYLADAHEIEIIRAPEDGSQGYKSRGRDRVQTLRSEFRFRTNFDFKGIGISADIVAMESDPNIEDIIMTADAPINGIAVDRSGQVWAHPYFAEDIQNSLYAINRTDPKDIADSFRRFERLQKRFPGLRATLENQ